MTRVSGRRWWFVGFLTVLLAISGYVIVRRWNSVETLPKLGPDSATILPGLHLLLGLGPSASYVVETSEGLVLVDTGLDPQATQLKREMTNLGLDWRSVKAVLLTHAHGDHTGGAEYLRVTDKAKNLRGAGDASVLKAGGPREAFFSTFYMPGQTTHRTNVDVELDGSESITVGDTTFQALAMPGHTPGSMCYLLEKSGRRILFGGDVITMLAGDGNPHSKGFKPLGTYSAYLSPRYRGDAKTSLESLRKLAAMPVPDLILPGHPTSDPTPQSPRLSEEQWQVMLRDGIREMETLLARYKTDGADFLDGHPKRLLPDVFYFGDYQGSAVYGFTVGDKFFVVDAPGNAGFAEFLAAKIQELGLPARPPTAILLTSCNAKDVAGLKHLVETSHAEVIAPPGGVETVKAICPPGTTVTSTTDLAARSWFPVTTFTLAGRGSNPVAYMIPFAGKKVLFSGRIPIMLDHYSVEGLKADISVGRDKTLEYLLSINQLESVAPDLWLPALPAEDQNANLYDTDWKYIISNNYRAGRSILEQIR